MDNNSIFSEHGRLYNVLFGNAQEVYDYSDIEVLSAPYVYMENDCLNLGLLQPGIHKIDFAVINSGSSAITIGSVQVSSSDEYLLNSLRKAFSTFNPGRVKEFQRAYFTIYADLTGLIEKFYSAILRFETSVGMVTALEINFAISDVGGKPEKDTITSTIEKFDINKLHNKDSQKVPRLSLSPGKAKSHIYAFSDEQECNIIYCQLFPGQATKRFLLPYNTNIFHNKITGIGSYSHITCEDRLGRQINTFWQRSMLLSWQGKLLQQIPENPPDKEFIIRTGDKKIKLKPSKVPEWLDVKVSALKKGETKIECRVDINRLPQKELVDTLIFSYGRESIYFAINANGKRTAGIVENVDNLAELKWISLDSNTDSQIYLLGVTTCGIGRLQLFFPGTPFNHKGEIQAIENESTRHQYEISLDNNWLQSQNQEYIFFTCVITDEDGNTSNHICKVSNPHRSDSSASQIPLGPINLYYGSIATREFLVDLVPQEKILEFNSTLDYLNGESGLKGEVQFNGENVFALKILCDGEFESGEGKFKLHLQYKTQLKTVNNYYIVYIRKVRNSETLEIGTKEYVNLSNSALKTITFKNTGNESLVLYQVKPVSDLVLFTSQDSSVAFPRLLVPNEVIELQFLYPLSIEPEQEHVYIHYSEKKPLVIKMKGA